MYSVSSLQCTLWCCFLQATFALASPCLCLWLEAEMISLTSKWRVCIVRVTHWKFSWSQQEILKLLIRAQTIITKTRMVKMNCEMALCWIKKKSKFIPKLETNFEAYTSLTNKLKCFKHTWSGSSSGPGPGPGPALFGGTRTFGSGSGSFAKTRRRPETLLITSNIF